MTEPSHEDNVNAPAPDELEDVRSFLSMHDHHEGSDESFPPTTRTLEAWLRRRGLVSPSTTIVDADLEWALRSAMPSAPRWMRTPAPPATTPPSRS